MWPLKGKENRQLVLSPIASCRNASLRFSYKHHSLCSPVAAAEPVLSIKWHISAGEIWEKPFCHLAFRWKMDAILVSNKGKNRKEIEEEEDKAIDIPPSCLRIANICALTLPKFIAVFLMSSSPLHIN